MLRQASSVRVQRTANAFWEIAPELPPHSRIARMGWAQLRRLKPDLTRFVRDGHLQANASLLMPSEPVTTRLQLTRRSNGRPQEPQPSGRCAAAPGPAG